ncbi:DUF2516 family protein [Glycomyces sp. TRM65418]|uniref:DUF2516 family protein n=1 Tax=Glycomyces sp. TRM65418 TaxID=2867006 RepID=UPI001CE66A98|nr:DUF2516 family protein [Glycomyces sp. TRM65418]MCC3762800.1 DUF2516 family protein [Glycomyces sp. TRM65418]QZD56830.1 DUF2516 family protein [Glycomyces sp. TRM65418]
MPEFDAAFAFEIRDWVSTIIRYGAALLSLIACIHCAMQKPDAFNALGTLSKGAWIGVLALSLVFALLFGAFGRPSLFTLIAIAAALVYLLDVRSGIKDIGGSVY